MFFLYETRPNFVVMSSEGNYKSTINSRTEYIETKISLVDKIYSIFTNGASPFTCLLDHLVVFNY